MTTIETPSVIRRLWKSVLSLGVLTVILGAAVLVWPGQSIVAAGILFVVYLLASGIAQVIAAFTVNSPTASRVVLFISGALSIGLGVFALRDYNDGAPVWLLALWIGVGFVFQGVSETALAVSFKELPERGWYIFLGVLTIIAGAVMLVWPISSIGVVDHRRRMARRHRDHRDGVGLECAQRSQESRARCGVAEERRRRLTHQSAC
jgi:uncharacterized membrane protein HdeD (DUF308 family)